MGALMSTAADMGKPSQSPAINSSLRFLFIFSFPFAFSFNSSVVYFSQFDNISYQFDFEGGPASLFVDGFFLILKYF